MKIKFLSVVFVTVLILISCGDSNVADITWEGTWLSTENYDQRGTFTFDLRLEYEELSGTITIPGMGIENLEILGEADKSYSSSGTGGGSTVVITYIDFSDLDNEVTFEASVYTHDIDSDTEIKGIYSNSATGDSGRWYCSYADRNDFSSISSVSLDSSIWNIVDICFDGENLWVLEVDTGSKVIYEVDEDNGNVLETFGVPGIIYNPNGLTWDGSNLWCLGDDSLYKLDKSCSVESSVPFEEGGWYLTYVSGSLWSIVGSFLMDEDELWEINPSNGNIEGSFDFYSRNLGGLASDGTNLWVSFSYDQYDWNVIQKLDLEGNVIERYNAPCYTPRVLASDGSFLYCIGSDAYSIERRIFKLGI